MHIRINFSSRSITNRYQRNGYLDRCYALIEIFNYNDTHPTCGQIVSRCKSTDIVRRIVVPYYSRVGLSLIAIAPTSAVAYLARSSAPIIAHFDVRTVLLNTELIPEREHTTPDYATVVI